MKNSRKSLSSYQEYVRQLSALLRPKFPLSQDYPKKIDLALNGQASRELREIIPLKNLRKLGAFFTGEKLAEKVIQNINVELFHKILDPACGTGDLLIAAAKKLPMMSDIETTLLNWGKVLYGYDVIEEFVEISKIRLALLAVKRLGYKKKIDIKRLKILLPNISVKNGLDKITQEKFKGLILINPPYTLKKFSNSINMGRGLISSAAIFLEKCISGLDQNSRIVAILPDVIRTGSRYAKLRKWIETHCLLNQIQLMGRFERDVDVDVFALDVKRSDGKSFFDWYKSKSNHERLENYCNVSVGSVVPHRHKEIGPKCAYITAKCLESSQLIKRVKHSRCFNGTKVHPPFVIIRRTSAPSDTVRASGAVVLGKRYVAIENHLIILQPKKNSIKKCKQILTLLKSKLANAWLNKRIRCRHLTTSSLKEMPMVINE